MQLIRKNWDNPIAQERLDLVFENRNHDYGAYVIRRDYSRTVLIAFFATFGFATLLATGPVLWNLIFPEHPVKLVKPGEIIYQMIEVNLEEKKLDIPEEKPKESVPQPQPKTTEQFSNIKVSEKDTSDMKTQDQLLTTNLGTKTIKSDSTAIVDPLPVEPKNTFGSNNGVTKYAEKMPGYPGGESAMLEFLIKNIKYPPGAREINLTGTVYLSFIVSTTGEISNVKVLRGIGGGCEEEAVRVVKKMQNWNPGMQNGNPVNVEFTLPVTFKLK